MTAWTPPRSALRLAAAMSLLAVAATACSAPDPGPAAETTRPASQTDTAPADGGIGGPSDGGGASDGGASDGGGVAEPELHPRVLLATEPGGPRLEADALAAVLEDRLGAPAECDGPLDLDGGDPQTCGAPLGGESEEDAVWVGQGVQVPGPAGEGPRRAVLFTVDVRLSDEASLALGEDRVLSALPMGSMYGAAPVPADQLGEDALRTLTSGSALTAPVTTYTAVRCTQALDFSQLEPVECLGVRADGAEEPLWVLPGPFAGTDQGLIVSSPAA
ncbi:hypothetical protein [Brachybacterium phenoliresistens]|uniref:Uncharacterized protein n=1 Tax=Brachybacterium phenoliresistens TaxID=396014 RepID=Z9JSX2_9MICO|nr:hypothetical protein [Brachybacterium phenoliresistens]EWS80862.1 hypothetical protein BF93_01480 [Brachybacterium phenoliresistens]